ncbi:MAG: hypothetical protein M1820_000371 [Bogoriella megaspora]|nr:MAG: hypothetical protein M1820_000371 [Bogoriella megaspora]
MAIISALRGVTVQVHMGGQSCTEYADDDDSSHQHETQNRVSKYIEAKSGQQFAIRIDVDKAYEYTVQPLCVRLFIDGSKMASSILTPELLLNRPCTVFTGATFQESEGMKLRPFIFSALTIEALKDLHILPRSPTPTPLEERLVDDLTREELRQLVRQLKNRLETAERIKPENKRSRNASGDENSDSDVKNVSPRQKKTSRLSTGPGNSATDEGNYRPD